MKLDLSKRRRLLFNTASVVRVVLGCVLLWSSLYKIRQPYDFLANVYDYELVGPKLGMFLAMVLPWLELGVGICLIGGVFVGGAMLITVVLMGVFTVAHASAIARGLTIVCGCFKAQGPGIVSYSTLLRNVLLLLGAFGACSVFLLMRSPERSEPAP